MRVGSQAIPHFIPREKKSKKNSGDFFGLPAVSTALARHHMSCLSPAQSVSDWHSAGFHASITPEHAMTPQIPSYNSIGYSHSAKTFVRFSANSPLIFA
jgi:hypothetical protein